MATDRDKPTFLQPASHAEKRRGSARREIELDAQAKQTDLAAVAISISDISETGFRFSSLAAFNIEKKLMLKIPGFEALHATFVWQDGDQYGCRFNRPLHEAVFVHISSKIQDG